MFLKQKGVPNHRGSSLWVYLPVLAFNLIAFLKPLYSSGGVHHAPLTGKERVTVAADLDLQFFFRGTGGEFIAAGTYYHGIVIKFRMYFLFHIVQLLETLTFLLLLLVGSYFTIPSIRAYRV